jgi:glycine cleavage system H lipoate-binding protein
MCKDTTVYTAAMAKWVKYTKSNEQTCGISESTAVQLKEVYAKTVQTEHKQHR